MVFTLQPGIKKRLDSKRSTPSTGQSLRGGLKIEILYQTEQPFLGDSGREGGRGENPQRYNSGSLKHFQSKL